MQGEKMTKFWINSEFTHGEKVSITREKKKRAHKKVKLLLLLLKMGQSHCLLLMRPSLDACRCRLIVEKRCNIFRMLGELGLRVRVKRAIKNFFLLSRRHKRRCTWGSKIQRQSRSTTDNRSYELSTLWPVERESFVHTNSTAYRHSSIDSYTKWKVIKVLSARLKVKKYFSARLPMLLSRCRRILY